MATVFHRLPKRPTAGVSCSSSVQRRAWPRGCCPRGCFDGGASFCASAAPSSGRRRRRPPPRRLRGAAHVVMDHGPRGACAATPAPGGPGGFGGRRRFFSSRGRGWPPG